MHLFIYRLISGSFLSKLGVQSPLPFLLPHIRSCRDPPPQGGAAFKHKHQTPLSSPLSWIHKNKSSKVNSFAKNSCKATFLDPSGSVQRLGKVDGRARNSEENQVLGGVLISGGEPSTASAYLYHISRAERGNRSGNNSIRA